AKTYVFDRRPFTKYAIGPTQLMAMIAAQRPFGPLTWAADRFARSLHADVASTICATPTTEARVLPPGLMSFQVCFFCFIRFFDCCVMSNSPGLDEVTIRRSPAFR